MTAERTHILRQFHQQKEAFATQIDEVITQATRFDQPRLVQPLERVKAAFNALEFPFITPDDIAQLSPPTAANAIGTIHLELASSDDYIVFLRNDARRLSDRIQTTTALPQSAQLVELSDALKECCDACLEFAATYKGPGGWSRWSLKNFVMRKLVGIMVKVIRRKVEAFERGVQEIRRLQ
ncbi:hypothetical protein ASPCADRAFT_3140 [Aspergillus carbonarius ITEM 5010]|uniref:Uncharacterized protein n=1 Tax=Aspergillus carbonarius (strain ITEM 5010) TaxID=602072 RepID=A0A1R3RUC5_ASPC5|nr:hypothetical protein ASPCADRAFT_3140 [Aspergillus carbonarius ITEM 5010]